MTKPQQDVVIAKRRSMPQRSQRQEPMPSPKKSGSSEAIARRSVRYPRHVTQMRPQRTVTVKARRA